MEITIRLREVYGVVKAYPACDKAEAFAAIAGTRTLTHATLCRVEALGYAIKNAGAALSWGNVQ